MIQHVKNCPTLPNNLAQNRSVDKPFSYEWIYFIKSRNKLFFQQILTLFCTKTHFVCINNKGFYFIVLSKFGIHVIKTVNSEIIHSKCHKIKQLCLSFGEVCCIMPINTLVAVEQHHCHHVVFNRWMSLVFYFFPVILPVWMARAINSLIPNQESWYP